MPWLTVLSSLPATSGVIRPSSTRLSISARECGLYTSSSTILRKTDALQYWSASVLRRMVDDDVYRPHSRADIESLVDEGLMTPEVAGKLDKTVSHGIYWWN